MPSQLQDPLAVPPATWSEQDISAAMARMERVCRVAETDGLVVSFDTSMPEPERTLLQSLPSLDGEGVRDDATEAHTELARFLHLALERLRVTARIESCVDGRLVASTRVGLGGDVTCIAAAVARPSALCAHALAVETELRARQAWARLVLATSQMAVRLALATGAGNPLLALPAAWAFMRSVLAEREQLDE